MGAEQQRETDSAMSRIADKKWGKSGCIAEEEGRCMAWHAT